MAEQGQNREVVWVAALLAAAVLARGVLFIYPGLDSDVAAIGLMAMHFLRGEISLISWGQQYGGTLEPLLAAPIFALFGPTPRALNAAPALASLVYVFFMHRIGRRLWGRVGGLATLACAALGPYYLLWFSTSARGLHAELLALGAALIWLTLRLLETSPGDRAYRRLALAFGLVAGVGFWTNLLLAGVIAPALLVLWRRHGRLPLTMAGALMLGGFLIGSSPLWWHNLQQNWGTLAFSTKERPYSGFAANLLSLLGRSLPVLLGAQVDRSYAWVVPGLGQAALLVWGGALLAALGAWGRDLLGYVRGRTEKAAESLLLLTACSVSAVFSILGGADLGSHRYLLGLYLVLPLPLAWAFTGLWQRGGLRRGLAGLGLGLVLVSNLVGVYFNTPLGDPEQRRMHLWQDDMAAKVIAHFRAENVTHVYCPEYWQAPLWTFLSREQVVFVQPFGERHPEYLDELLRAQSLPGLVVARAESQLWRRSLTALGATWREKVVADSLVAFTAIQPPAVWPQPLASRDWQAQAHPNAQSAAQAWDHNATTRWSTGESQRPGQWYHLDLGREVEGVCQAMLFYGQVEDRPRVLRLEGSSDGRSWHELLRVKERAAPAWWSGGKPVFTPDSPWEELRFAPLSLRYLRLNQEGEYAHSFWSLCEMLVGVQSGEPDPARPQWAAAAAWIAREIPGENRVWAEPALNAWLPRRLQAHARPRARPAWLREYLLPDLLLPEGKLLRLALDQSRLPWAEAAFKAAGWLPRSHTRYGVAWMEAIPPRSESQSPARGQTLTATPQEGGRLLIQSHGPLPGLLLEPPASQYLAPGEMTLEMKGKGGGWEPLEFTSTWPGQLYLGGWLPLAVRPSPLKLDLTQPATGDLRLGKAPWAVGPIPPASGPHAVTLP